MVQNARFSARYANKRVENLGVIKAVQSRKHLEYAVFWWSLTPLTSGGANNSASRERAWPITGKVLS